MKRRDALLIALLFLGCVPIDPPVVDPPEPPVLTMRQQQFEWQKDRKLYGYPVVSAPHNSGGKVIVAK